MNHAQKHKLILEDGYHIDSAFVFDHRDVAHLSTCDDGCLALAELLGWKVKCYAHFTHTGMLEYVDQFYSAGIYANRAHRLIDAIF